MNNYNQIKQLPKYLKVLNALRIGMEVKLENDSRGNPQEAPEFIPGRNADLNYFIELCEKIPDDIIIMLENVMMKCLERTENKNEND